MEELDIHTGCVGARWRLGWIFERRSVSLVTFVSALQTLSDFVRRPRSLTLTPTCLVVELQSRQKRLPQETSYPYISLRTLYITFYRTISHSLAPTLSINTRQDLI